MAEKQTASKPAAKKGNKAMIIVLVVSMIIGGGLAFVMLQMFLPAPHSTIAQAPPKPGAPEEQPKGGDTQNPKPAKASAQAAPAENAEPKEEEKAAEASAEDGKAKPAKPVIPMVDLKPFVVTLNESGAPHYMKITVKAELDSMAAKEEMETREAEIRDRLILYLSSLTLDKTKGIRAKQQIRGNIVHRANAILERGKITRVFISEFITQ